VTLSGFLVINKNAGISSHAVVSGVRRLTGQKKAGHTGTLDPFATGVLPVALGDATKVIQFLDESRKGYRAVMRLGAVTDTQDFTGIILEQRDWSHITGSLIHQVVGRFIGAVQQIPPMYSAIKRDGIPLYRIARQGGEVERELRDITVYSLVIEKIELPDVTINVSCSRGTYVRTLAHDIGAALGCGAHLISLERTCSGSFSMESAATLEQLAVSIEKDELSSLIIPQWKLLSHLAVIELDDLAAKRLYHGVPPGPGGVKNGEWPLNGQRIMLWKDGLLLAVAEGVNSESVRLLRVFV
jgi:tRNA pseudouridine55 synthase